MTELVRKFGVAYVWRIGFRRKLVEESLLYIQ